MGRIKKRAHRAHSLVVAACSNHKTVGEQRWAPFSGGGVILVHLILCKPNSDGYQLEIAGEISGKTRQCNGPVFLDICSVYKNGHNITGSKAKKRS